MSDIFQKKARLVKITLPLNLNKEKMTQKEEKEQAAASKKSINLITRQNVQKSQESAAGDPPAQ